MKSYKLNVTAVGRDVRVMGSQRVVNYWEINISGRFENSMDFALSSENESVRNQSFSSLEQQETSNGKK